MSDIDLRIANGWPVGDDVKDLQALLVGNERDTDAGVASLFEERTDGLDFVVIHGAMLHLIETLDN